MILLYANKNRLTVKKTELLTSGSVKVNETEFAFSADWDGLKKTAVFRAGDESREVLLDGTGRCGIPWEVLEKPGQQLYAGVYGSVSGGDIVLPTVWAHLGAVLEGTSPGESARPPTPDLWEQELAKKGDGLSYDGLNLSLTSGGKPLSSVPIIGGEGPVYKFGHGLKQEGVTISVNAVDNFSGDNTLPMTAAGVYASVGNIEALLETI